MPNSPPIAVDSAISPAAEFAHLDTWSGYLPGDCFDIHAHLYHQRDAIDKLPDHLPDTSGTVGWQQWRQHLATWMGPFAPLDGLFFAFPAPTIDVGRANRLVLDQVTSHPGSRALLLVTPSDEPEEVERQVRQSGVAGFKVYHVYADRSDTQQAEVGEFLPEWVWELANTHELLIMLHLVRSRALADPANQHYLRQHCLQYPHARLMLAHAGRGFCAAHTVEGVRAVRDLGNAYFDTSAICESPAFEAILRTCGPSRLAFGTDFPVSESRGRCVSVADRFVWLDPQAIAACDHGVRPTLVGVESLRALVAACQGAGLVERDLERVFRDNAHQLLGLHDQGSNDKTHTLYHHAKQLIPGGTQLLSKRPELYAADHWPAYYREARGCTVTDLDGRQYLDMSTGGIGSCLLGFADPDVDRAVVRRVEMGSMCSLNAPEEVELAEMLIALHPWADQVRYARTGGEANAIAIRTARAATGRDLVAFCGYHGWSDWYMAANLPDDRGDSGVTSDRLLGHLLPGLLPAGVPRGLTGTALPFSYNQIEQLESIVGTHGDQLAAVIMEPLRTTEPQPDFLPRVRQLCDDCGASLIFDEITSAWRFALGGVHLQLGVQPDIAVFAKAISNGFPMAAVVGRRDVMQALHQTFVSSTYWTDGIGPTAAIATLRKMQQVDVPRHVAEIGRAFRTRLYHLASEHGLPLSITGRDALLHLAFEGPDGPALGTQFTTQMLAHGVLSSRGFYPTLAHDTHHLEQFFAAAERVLANMHAR